MYDFSQSILNIESVNKFRIQTEIHTPAMPAFFYFLYSFSGTHPHNPLQTKELNKYYV